MEGMHTDTEMERILSAGLGDVFVGADTGSFQCFRGELFIFIGDEVAAEGEVVNGGTFPTKVENADLNKP